MKRPAPQPFLPPRAHTLWRPPLLCLRPPPAPGHPDTQFLPKGSATAPSPDRCAGCAVSRNPGRATPAGRTRTQTGRTEARPRDSSSPFLLRSRRGQAPRRSGGGSQIVSSLLAAPLPPPCRPAVGRTVPFHGPSSSHECCERRAGSREWSWGQASTTSGMSLGLVWDFVGNLRSPFWPIPPYFDVLRWGPPPKVRMDGKGLWALFWRLPAPPSSSRFIEPRPKRTLASQPSSHRLLLRSCLPVIFLH